MINRIIKEVTVTFFHYDSDLQLEEHVANSISAYNFDLRLKIREGLTPYEFTCNQWTREP